jgi:hypothetical protein
MSRPTNIPEKLSMDDPIAEYLWDVARAMLANERIDGQWATADALAWWSFEEWSYLAREVDPSISPEGESAAAALCVAMRAATDFRELLDRLVSAHEAMVKAHDDNPIGQFDEATPEGVASILALNAAGRRLNEAWEAATEGLRRS